MTIVIVVASFIAGVLVVALARVVLAIAREVRAGKRDMEEWRRAVQRIANDHERQDNGWDWEHGRRGDR